MPRRPRRSREPARRCFRSAPPGRVRDNAVAQAPPGRTDRGPRDDETQACLARPPSETLGRLAAPARAGGSAASRRRAPRPLHRRPELVSRRGVQATNTRHALPRALTRVDGRPPHRRAGAKPALCVGRAWRRSSPPSGKTFSHRNRAEPDAEGGGPPSQPRPRSLPFGRLCHDEL
jgi:hypothetical protein